MIMKPTIGRVVFYNRYGTPGGEHKSEESAAIITKVHNDSCVDLCVLNPSGIHFNQKVIQGDQPGHWEWMPYQKGQAQKTEELEEKLQSGKVGCTTGAIDARVIVVNEKRYNIQQYLYLLYEAAKCGVDVHELISEQLKIFEATN